MSDKASYFEMIPKALRDELAAEGTRVTAATCKPLFAKTARTIEYPQPVTLRAACDWLEKNRRDSSDGQIRLADQRRLWFDRNTFRGATPANPEDSAVARLAAQVRRLPRSQRKGSRPRCLLLTLGAREEIAQRLSELSDRELHIGPDSVWAPCGFADPRELSLGSRSAVERGIVTDEQRVALTRWWLGTGRGKQPTWDLVATGTADGRPAMLLVEAKAHEGELSRGPRTGKRAHDVTIQAALREASAALNAVVPGWELERAPYQLANRIALAWKLASLGIPVVLAYAGFLYATEMERSRLLWSHEGWEAAVREHARSYVPDQAWGCKLPVGGAWLRLVLHSRYVPMPNPCSRCGSQTIPLLYGMPSSEMSGAVKAGAFRMRGCMVSRDSPTRTCSICLDR